jgi:MtN3 and saliva related transmembrane protein
MNLTVVILGWIATILTTISFVPQAIATIRSKSTAGISLGMYVLFIFGMILWIAYGAFISATQEFMTGVPIWVGNAITLVFSSIILGFKINNVVQGKETISNRKIRKDNQ